MAFFEDNAGPGIADASGPAALFGCAVRRGYPQAGSLSPEAIACGPLAQAAVQISHNSTKEARGDYDFTPMPIVRNIRINN
ncbi:hypothetical protein QOT89_08205 [Pseudomonas aeruginosa]